MAKFSPKDLEGLCSDILISAGVDPKEAWDVALGIVIANRRGIDSHGVVRLPVYMARLEKGLVEKKTVCETVSERAATALLDAGNGWGAVAGKSAMELAINKAKKAGVGAVGVRNSNHYGIAAHYGMMALGCDMIGIAMTNASPSLAPWGGKEAYFGTNPICICIPTYKERPVVYDGATSVVARGKVVLADKKGERIPATWAADRDGRPTTDPAEAVKGLLLPMGGYKGTGFGLAVDVLCGLLNMGASAREIGDLYAPDRKHNVGHYFQAIDIKAFCPPEIFKKKVDAMVKEIHAIAPAEGVERIFLPGEIEFEKYEETERYGIEIPQEVLFEVERCAKKYGVKMPSPIF